MAAGLVALAVAAAVASGGGARGPAVPFAALPGWTTGDPRPALTAFRASCAGAQASRAALPAPETLASACRAASAVAVRPSAGQARAFFEAAFAPHLVAADAFFTGYYEPVVDGSLERTADFATPLYAPPPDLVAAPPGRSLPGLDPPVTVARRGAGGRLVPLPDRAAIEAGALRQAPLVYLRDPIEAFFVQVQGSARIRLRDGALRRLAYAGRNGYPYTPIGRILVERLHVPPAEMGMSQLKAWIRANGQGPDEAGGKLMQMNRSYIFFRFDPSLASGAGPVGGSGVNLAAGTSLAIDRTRWPYGLPFYVDTTVPSAEAAAAPFRRLMVGQDTGSAIVGAARGDIFLGTGAAAAARAGALRSPGALYVLWPRGATETAP